MDTSKISAGGRSGSRPTAQKQATNNKTSHNQRSSGMRKQAHQPAAWPANIANITINTGKNMLIGSEFQINSGIHTAKTAQVHTATSTTS